MTFFDDALSAVFPGRRPGEGDGGLGGRRRAEVGDGGGRHDVDLQEHGPDSFDVAGRVDGIEGRRMGASSQAEGRGRGGDARSFIQTEEDALDAGGDACGAGVLGQEAQLGGPSQIKRAGKGAGRAEHFQGRDRGRGVHRDRGDLDGFFITDSVAAEEAQEMDAFLVDIERGRDLAKTVAVHGAAGLQDAGARAVADDAEVVLGGKADERLGGDEQGTGVVRPRRQAVDGIAGAARAFEVEDAVLGGDVQGAGAGG